MGIDNRPGMGEEDESEPRVLSEYEEDARDLKQLGRLIELKRQQDRAKLDRLRGLSDLNREDASKPVKIPCIPSFNGMTGEPLDTAAAKIEHIATQYPSATIPEFSKWGDFGALSVEESAQLKLNFIKKRYISGEGVRLQFFSTDTGERLDPAMQVAKFRENYPELRVPDFTEGSESSGGLSPEEISEKQIRYIQENYVVLPESEILAEMRKKEEE